jgi:hypothetical protein
MEAVAPDDGRASRSAPLKLGDFSWLVKAAEAKPFDIEALDKEVKGGRCGRTKRTAVD